MKRSSVASRVARWFVACVVVCSALPHVPRAAAAQPPVSDVTGALTSVTIAPLLAEGWAALGRGDAVSAARTADRALTESGGSLAAIALSVEVEVVSGGTSVPGLDIYERWLAARRVDAPYLLRRIAQAHLRRIVVQPGHPGRFEAATLLVADGDTSLAAELARGASTGTYAEARLLAAARDERGVAALIEQLRAPGSAKLRIIDALAASGSPSAVPALADVLSDPRVEHRAAAADALGRLGATDVIPQLTPLLQDEAFPVRLAAAAALYRLDDNSGINILEELLSSEHAAVRLAAAQAIAVRPSGSWEAVVRGLTAADDETVRLGAARLIAPRDAVLAAQVLGELSRSGNLAVREEAGRLFAARVSADFAGLRRFLRNPDRLTSVRAAGRILELTR